ncbi:hypothetical protein OSB04_016976 [Centaurea solstitialis]|uniref:Uncharacterized protein n=1 Tax=Centaurea solstitialis TaxID=347529 RepID=A0AA38TF88_9ASTR|nr:hypothetical protein OSB04_016976 [Centaurea solstitialis]
MSKANISISSRYERFGCRIPVRSSYRSFPNRICIHYRWYSDFVAFHKAIYGSYIIQSCRDLTYS